MDWMEAAKHGRRCKTRTRAYTLLEVMIALFILLVGIVGVLAALPTGVNSAAWVIFQDAALHLSHSKFAEFRRDRIDPAGLMSGALLNQYGAIDATAKEEGGQWRVFEHGKGEAYEYFDDIERYVWKVELRDVGRDAGNAPVHGGGTTLEGLKFVTLVVHMRGTSREFRFSQYLFEYGN